jgi:hypothetical protein
MRRILTAGFAVSLAAAGAARAQKAPEIKQNGQYVMQWKDDKIQVVIGLRFASTRFPSKWLMIETDVSATGDKPIRIDREDVNLVVPGGTRINLASQKALTEGLPEVRRDYQEAAITRDPLDGYFVSPSRAEKLGFFAPPTTDITYEQVTVDRTTLAQGYLFFHAPGDKFPPGRYVLEIYNKDVDVKLPFTLPAGKTKPKGKGDKTVPW